MNPDVLAEHIFSGVECLRTLLWSCHAANSEPLWQEALLDMQNAMHEVVQMKKRGSRRVQGIYVTSADLDRLRRLRLLVTKLLETGERSPEIEPLARECLERLMGKAAVSRLGLPAPSEVPQVNLPAEPLAHAVVVSNLFIQLGTLFHRKNSSPGGWVIMASPPVWYEPEPVVPDLAGWRADRFQVSGDGTTLPVPDWVCEVVSPQTALADRGTKVRDYMAHRVRYGWWFDLVTRTFEVFGLEGDRWTHLNVFEADMKARAEPFDSIELDLSLVWTP